MDDEDWGLATAMLILLADFAAIVVAIYQAEYWIAGWAVVVLLIQLLVILLTK